MADKPPRYHPYPYQEEENDQYPPGEIILRPIVDVRLRRGQKEFPTKALVDTGSPLTLFDRGTAEVLGFTEDDFTQAARTIQILGDDRLILPGTVQVTLPPFTDVTWTAQVWFFKDEYNQETFNVPFGLLGNVGFLDQWVVTFNFRENYLLVEEPNSFAENLPVDPYKEFLEQYDSDWQRPPGQ